MERLQTEASFASEGGASVISTQNLVEALAKIPPPKVDVNVDVVPPKQIALKYEAACTKKGKDLDFWSTFVLALHAGIFVSFGASFFTVVATAATGATAVSYGVNKFASGLAFCTGLAMVILCGSELFTGNCLLVLAWATKRITTFQMFRNWIIVYIGNFIGSVIIAVLQVWGRNYESAGNQVGVQALAIANTKGSRNWGACYALGILCNIVVCWAVWMTLAARESSGKLLVFILPITAFAAQGFEHCVANMYFLPVALLIKTYAPPKFWASTGKNPDKDYGNVAIGWLICYNWCPATLGNWSGAILFLGTVYWYLYLRDEDHLSRFEFGSGDMKFLASPPSPVKKRKSKKQKQPN